MIQKFVSIRVNSGTTWRVARILRNDAPTAENLYKTWQEHYAATGSKPKDCPPDSIEVQPYSKNMNPGF
jgi:hypothetical protein